MTHHLQHGAAGAQGAETTNANQHKAHVANRAVGDLALEIALGKGGEGRIDDVHHAQHHQQGGEMGVGLRQQLHIEPQQGVAAHLQQDACQQHMHRRRGLAMGIGQPGMEGHDRQLDAKGNQQAGITEHLELLGEVLGH